MWSDSPAFVKYLARTSDLEEASPHGCVDVMNLSGLLAEVCTKHGRRMAETFEIVFCPRVVEVSIRFKSDRAAEPDHTADTGQPSPVRGFVATAIKRSFGSLLQRVSGVVEAGRRATKYVKRTAEALADSRESETKVDLNLFRNLSLGPEAVDSVVKIALGAKGVLIDNADELPLAGLSQTVRSRGEKGQFFVIEIDTEGLYRTTLDDFLALKRHIDSLCEHPTTARVFYAENYQTVNVRVTVHIKPFKNYDSVPACALVTTP